MSAPDTSFYVTGGTLSHDAPSYVPRQADLDLYDGLTRGDFCYVLTARQMGKSSLMARTAHRLRQEGVAVVLLDLTAIGQNLTAEQWYDGLRELVGQQLDLEDAMDDFWHEHARLGPLQRWMAALREVVLTRMPGRIVLFIDEIDTVQSLPFSTDEFFAGIRECYNRRIQDPEFQRLTFCLLGVASPSDLIRDTRLTPFNIGRRVELTDFTEAEALPLAAGLVGTLATENTESTEEEARRVLQRVLYWTGGHPYLTQRLCRTITEVQTAAPSSEVRSSTSVPSVPSVPSVVRAPSQLVDRLCDDLFLSRKAREQDDNLLFVRERLLRSEADTAALLDLYGRVWGRGRVPDDETNPLVSLLRLAGITRVVDGGLRVRNRIYARVFDRAWVTAHMPDAELRRQRAAYRRGLWRAAVVSTVVLAAMGGLALTAVDQARRANRISRQEARQRQRAEEREETGRRYLYGARLNLAQQAVESENFGRARDLLESLRPTAGREDLRGFDWRYLWRLAQGPPHTLLSGHSAWVGGVAFSPDGRILASGGGDRAILLWDIASRRHVASLLGHLGGVGAVAFSPAGDLLASASEDKTVRLWDVASRREVGVLTGFRHSASTVAFSPDGRTLAVGGEYPELQLWDVPSRRRIAILKGYNPVWHALAFSPDGRLLASGDEPTDTVRLWDTARKREVGRLRGHRGSIYAIAFSPDGKMLAYGCGDYTARLWNLATRKEIATLRGHQQKVAAVAFSPDGKRLATGSWDQTVRLWDLATRQSIVTFGGHSDIVGDVAFSPDGRRLASAGGDGTVRVWDPAWREPAPYLRQTAGLWSLSFSPDGSILAVGASNGHVQLREVATGRRRATLSGHKASVREAAFSPDGKMLASVGDDATAVLWEVATGRRMSAWVGVATSPRALAFSPDGRILAVGSKNGRVRLWDCVSRRAVGSLAAHSGWVYGVAFSPNGKILATGGFQNTDSQNTESRIQDRIRLWDVATRREMIVRESSDAHGLPLFLPDGKTLIASILSMEEGIKLWDVASQQAIAGLGGSGAYHVLALSPDGRTVAQADRNFVRLCNLTVQQQLAVLKGHTDDVNAVAFSPDGNTLASAGDDGTVRLWRAPPWEETDRLRRVIGGGGDRTVVLQWRPSATAVAYNVYRDRDGARRDRIVKLWSGTDPSFVDRGPWLANSRPQRYAVAPIFRRARVGVVEGPRAFVQAIPRAAPTGFIGFSINETPSPASADVESAPPVGSVEVNAATGEIRLRGSGADIWAAADGCYFLAQPVTGDCRITVQMPRRPTPTHPWARAGLMIRESVEPGSRQASLLTTVARGLGFSWRQETDNITEWNYLIRYPELKLPMTLRLTRRGDTITPEILKDGRSFELARAPFRFRESLPGTLYVGLAVTAIDASRICEARFRDLKLEKGTAH